MHVLHRRTRRAAHLAASVALLALSACGSDAPSVLGGSDDGPFAEVIDLTISPSVIASDGTRLWSYSQEGNAIHLLRDGDEPGPDAPIGTLPDLVDLAHVGGQLWGIGPGVPEGMLERVDATTGEPLESVTKHAGGRFTIDGDAVYLSAPGGGVIEIDAASGLVRRTIPGGIDSRAYTAGGGSVWFGDGNSVVRVDSASDARVAEVALPSLASSMWFAGGAVWVAHGADNTPRAPGVLSRIDPTTNAITATIDDSPIQMATVGDALWMTTGTSRSGPGDPTPLTYELLRLDAATGEVLDRFDLPANPGDIAVAGDQLWILLEDTPAKLARVDASD